MKALAFAFTCVGCVLLFSAAVATSAVWVPLALGAAGAFLTSWAITL